MAGTIAPEALRARLDKGEHISVLDVREAEDFEEWRIPGALHCDASADLRVGRPGPVATFDLLPHDKPVVAVCYQGVTSRVAADALRARGFDAVSMEGGMKAWTFAWNAADVALPGSKAHVVQVRRTGKGCLSYLVASNNEAAVIDPSLDPAIYQDLARARGWTIRLVLETHVHADHLSRARALCEATGAKLLMPRNGRVHFPYEPLDDGARVWIGQSEVQVLHTPGHTPESVCYHMDGRVLFSGDTLFLDAVGRPDLVSSDRAAARARALSLHGSLHKLARLPADTLVLPCHTGQPVPFDHRPLASTLRQAQARVPMLGLARDEFVERLLERLGETPPNHETIVKANEAGAYAGLDAEGLEAGANRCAAG